MDHVIVIKGAVTFPITLDPSVWIFDDRKFPLEEWHGNTQTDEDEQAQYLSGTGAQWDRELREGAVPPSERTSLIEHRKALDGDYAIRFAPFLENAAPKPEARYVRIHRRTGEPVTITLNEAKQAILQFSKDGKPIREKGPVYLFLPEFREQGREPLDSITAFEVF